MNTVHHSLNGCVLAATLLLAGCAPDITSTDFYSRHPDELPSANERVVVGRASSGDLSFRLEAADSLHWGYNEVSVVAEKDGDALDDGSYALAIEGSIQGSVFDLPFEPEELDKPGTIGFYLIEPVSGKAAWGIDLSYDVAGSKGTVTMDVDVQPAVWVQYDADGEYYVAWLEPRHPTTGEEPFELAMHRFTGSRFEPVDDAQIDLYPYMDMGGGEGHSTPYQAPVHEGGGRYAGSINFIMTGGWEMTVSIRRDATGPDTVIFERFTVE